MLFVAVFVCGSLFVLVCRSLLFLLLFFFSFFFSLVVPWLVLFAVRCNSFVVSVACCSLFDCLLLFDVCCSLWFVRVCCLLFVVVFFCVGFVFVVRCLLCVVVRRCLWLVVVCCGLDVAVPVWCSFCLLFVV